LRFNLRVLPFDKRRIVDLPSSAYDGVLATLGYELRSREVPIQLSGARLKHAPAFPDQHVGSYTENRQTLQEAGYEIAPVEDDDFLGLVEAFIGGCRDLAADRLPRIAIDISSMSRGRIAAIVEGLTSDERGTPLVADLLYAPATFDAPASADTPILSVEPVSPWLAGWWDDLDQPLAAVIGVGYELEHASSAIDRLEPEDTYVFVPHGDEAGYAAEVQRANQGLLAASRDIQQVADYDVTEAYQTFQSIDTLVRRLRSEHRVAVVPLGPKIFAACAALVCSLHYPGAQFIRVSAGERREPIIRRANGTVCGLRLITGAVDDSAVYHADLAIPGRLDAADDASVALGAKFGGRQDSNSAPDSSSRSTSHGSRS